VIPEPLPAANSAATRRFQPRAVRPLAVSVHDEAVLGQRESEFAGPFALALLDGFVLEFLDMAALRAHQVIVVVPALKFEHGVPALEVVAPHQARGLELGQHPINRRQPDILVEVAQLPVDLLGRQMPRRVALQHLEDFQARQRDLEAYVAQILRFHGCPCVRDFNYYRTVTRRGKHMRILLLLILAALLGGCELIYKLPTRQGNVIEQKQLDQLEIGMTREQVRFLLGTPIAASAYRPERWDYVGYYRSPRGKVFSRTVSLHFGPDNKLTQMEGVQMAGAEAALESPDIGAVLHDEKQAQLEDERNEGVAAPRDSSAPEPSQLPNP
jgi:outer membrane protein assembly factor BamE